MKEYVGAEQEMHVYGPLLKLPDYFSAKLTDAFGGILPREITGIVAHGINKEIQVSWKKFYKQFVSEGGFPQKHKKGGFSLKGVWLDDGGYYYGDIANDFLQKNINYFTGLGICHPEFCTPITEVKKGFAREAKDAVMAHRARAVKAAGKDERVRVSNMHYNVSISKTDHIFLNDLADTLGAAYALLMFSDRCRFYEWVVRKEKGASRLELKAPALMDPEQIEATYAFLAGTMEGAQNRYWNYGRTLNITSEKDSEADLSHGMAWYINFGSGRDYQRAILGKGPDAILKTSEGNMTAREYFEECLHLYKEYIESVATDRQMNILKELAEGERKFEIEIKPSHNIDAEYIKENTGKTPREAVDAFTPTGAAALFAYSVRNPVMTTNDGRTLKLKEIYWDKIVYEVLGNDREISDYTVPLEEMDYFMERCTNIIDDFINKS